MANQKVEEKKPNVVLYVLILVVVIVAGYFIYTMINDKKPIEHKVNTEKVDKQKETQEPVFKKQGELDFISAKDKKVIKKVDIEIADNAIFNIEQIISTLLKECVVGVFKALEIFIELIVNH